MTRLSWSGRTKKKKERKKFPGREKIPADSSWASREARDEKAKSAESSFNESELSYITSFSSKKAAQPYL